jgi:hypothetical protein
MFKFIQRKFNIQKEDKRVKKAHYNYIDSIEFFTGKYPNGRGNVELSYLTFKYGIALQKYGILGRTFSLMLLLHARFVEFGKRITDCFNVRNELFLHRELDVYKDIRKTIARRYRNQHSEEERLEVDKYIVSYIRNIDMTDWRKKSIMSGNKTKYFEPRNAAEVLPAFVEFQMNLKKENDLKLRELACLCSYSKVAAKWNPLEKILDERGNRVFTDEMLHAF